MFSPTVIKGVWVYNCCPPKCGHSVTTGSMAVLITNQATSHAFEAWSYFPFSETAPHSAPQKDVMPQFQHGY